MNNIKQGMAIYQLGEMVASTFNGANALLCDSVPVKTALSFLTGKGSNSNSTTVDVEFDKLNYHLKTIKKSFNSMINNLKLFAVTVSLLVTCMESIQQDFNKILISKIYNDTILIDIKQSIIDANSNYQNTIYLIRDNIIDPLDLFNTGIKIKIDQVLKMIDLIEIKINKRSLALNKYDDSYNLHEQLFLKQKSGDVLTTKKSQKLMYLDRKLDEYNSIYKEINKLLKTELIVFLELADDILDDLKSQIYYSHLMIIYQFQYHLQSFLLVVSPSNNENINLIDNLSIINIRINDLKNLKNDNSSKCKALYDFNAVKNDDLSMKRNDLIKILDKNGLWWKGELNGRVGIFPSNYVEEV